MKYIFIGLILLTIAYSCSQKRAFNNVGLVSNKEIKNDFVFKSKDFEAFYNKFITDTVYQLTKVRFPIKGKYSDFDGDIEWTKEKWTSIKWDFRIEMNKSDDSISIEQDTNKFFFGSYCRDCGFSFEMEFEKNQNEWFLVYRQENNY